MTNEWEAIALLAALAALTLLIHVAAAVADRFDERKK